jgi:ankyrin repeat protein
MTDLSRTFPASRLSEDSLIMAAGQGDRKEVKRLLDTAGRMSDSAKDDALCIAALRGHADIVETMLQAGADIHALNDEPLRFAKMREHADVLKVLNAWTDREQTQHSSPRPYRLAP